MNKLKTAVAFGAGYVLGAQAGRARYEQLKHQASRVAEHPRTQALVRQASDRARDRAVVARERLGSRLPARLGGTRPATDAGLGPLPDADPTPGAVPPPVIDLTDAHDTSVGTPARAAEEDLQTRSGSLPGTA